LFTLALIFYLLRKIELISDRKPSAEYRGTLTFLPLHLSTCALCLSTSPPLPLYLSTSTTLPLPLHLYLSTFPPLPLQLSTSLPLDRSTTLQDRDRRDGEGEELRRVRAAAAPRACDPLPAAPPRTHFQQARLCSAPSTLNPQPSTLNPQPSTLNPHPSSSPLSPKLHAAAPISQGRGRHPQRRVAVPISISRPLSLSRSQFSVAISDALPATSAASA